MGKGMQRVFGSSAVHRIDWRPLHAKDSPGLLVNRVLDPYLNYALNMVEQSLAPETTYAAMTRFGMPMGSIGLVDTVRLDIRMRARKALAGGEAEPPKRIAALVASDNLGKKTDSGFHVCQIGKARTGADGAVTQKLIERLIAPYLKEAQAVVAEGIVADADLADAGLIFGTGFAPFRGGPLQYIGAKTVGA